MRRLKQETWLNYLDKASSKKTIVGDLPGDPRDLLASPNNHFSSLFYHCVPMVYLLDYTSSKYLTVSKTASHVLGHDPRHFLEGGVEFAIDCYQKDHLKIFNDEIFPDRLDILRTIPPAEHSNHIFTYNLCLRNSKGELLNLLQRNIFYSDEQGNPLLSMGMIVNIDRHGQHNSIVQMVEKKIDKDPTCLPDMVFEKSYHLNPESRLFTKREKETLLWMADGLTSKEIAGRLSISEGTVVMHRKNMMQKAGVLNVAALVAFSFRKGLI